MVLKMSTVPTTASSDTQADDVIPQLDTFRRMPVIFDTISQLLGSYEEQARTSGQEGRQPGKFGQYVTMIAAGF